MTDTELHTVNDDYMDEEEAELAADFYEAMMRASRESPRSQQAGRFQIGVSDLGFCPERTRRMLAGQVPEPTDVLPAWIGTALGDHAEKAYKAAHPDVIVQGSVEVTFKIPVDNETWTIKVPGHPDIIDPANTRMVDVKGLALDTPIPTPSGWTTMRDLRVGDTVVDRDGRPCRVTVKSPVKSIDCWRVTFRNGHSVICDDEHRWVVVTRGRTEDVWTVNEMAQWKAKGKPLAVPLGAAIRTPEVDLPLDAWLLGYWLGNGHMSNNAVTAHLEDAEHVAQRARAAGWQTSIRPDKRGALAAHVGIHHGKSPKGTETLHKVLASIGVVGERLIPPLYLRASVDQRRELLRGLMDSDGTWNRPRRRVTFSSTQEHFAKEVAELARSLGERVCFSSHKATGYGKTVMAYAVEWTPTFNPFSTPRKADRVEFGKQKLHQHRVISVERVPSVPTQCISVDSPTHTYLCGELMVPTHNTDYLLADAERNGPSTQQRFQRHAYGVGAWQAGYFPGADLSDIQVGNVWIDRSGQDRRVHVDLEPLDLDVIAEAEDWLADVVYHLVNDEEAQKTPPREMCEVVCLAGETEVVTRYGIRQIADLAGEKHPLLVPSAQRSGLTWHGDWVEAEVKSFGVQPLRRVTLTRRRQTKVVHATADHQWLVRDMTQKPTTGRTVRTDDLTTGDLLRPIRKNNSGGVIEQPVGVLHGFVFGDGAATGHDCRVTVFDNSISKPSVMHPRLSGHKRHRDSRDEGWTYSGLPSTWKQAPDLSESIGYLTSWLAGYFAADGKVDKLGKPVLTSARYENMQLVRSICAIVGIGYGPVRSEVRPAGRTKVKGEHTLYHVSLSAATLPDWFVLNPHHRARLLHGAKREPQWRVVSVEETDRVEKVYCAVVPGVEAFALSDGLLTHNCGYFDACRALDTDTEGLITDEGVLAQVVMYREGVEMATAGDRLKKAARAALESMGMVAGFTPDGAQLRWTNVNGSLVPEHYRRGYTKIDLRIPKGKK